MDGNLSFKASKCGLLLQRCWSFFTSAQQIHSTAPQYTYLKAEPRERERRGRLRATCYFDVPLSFCVCHRTNIINWITYSTVLWCVDLSIPLHMTLSIINLAAAKAIVWHGIFFVIAAATFTFQTNLALISNSICGNTIDGGKNTHTHENNSNSNSNIEILNDLSHICKVNMV